MHERPAPSPRPFRGGAPDLSEEVNHALEQGITLRRFSATAWAFGNQNGLIAEGAAGETDPETPEQSVPVTESTLFDLASLTKIVVLWPLIGHLQSTDRINLDDNVQHLLPEVPESLSKVTVLQLLTHTAGLPKDAFPTWLVSRTTDGLRKIDPTIDQSTFLNAVLAAPLEAQPGDRVIYSDRGALILGLIIERTLETSLAAAADRFIWKPLGMFDTRFGPLNSQNRMRAAATVSPAGLHPSLTGIVHDPSARLMGGVAANAGVFSTIHDIARFAQRVVMSHNMNVGLLSSMDSSWTRDSLTVLTKELLPARGLMWHPDPDFSESGTWMHNGYTGTSIWVNPQRNLWAVLLTNRTYSSDALTMARVRREFWSSILRTTLGRTE
ncbi:serine hydrolase [Rathayibacter sp. VKM Ac-2804]|uniref:serine hydrolase domain-containing protein n=1 Tax=Rathayibacter sp. VKM Ac-2804 TaxID=2609257 RepID=UPI00132F4C70|nr:serine hydrolase domain-containing protein [Rathayibacter sp. VKM Ac-2804]QHF22874.1 serine hydrolase [Rathayibacter sp. VKM Ac-2804]